MADDDKALEFKHAHITGQAMRDHWGPIVDRIAAETADWRDEWIYDLITENERLNAIVADRLLGSSVDHRTLKDIIAENERLREALAIAAVWTAEPGATIADIHAALGET